MNNESKADTEEVMPNFKVLPWHLFLWDYIKTEEDWHTSITTILNLHFKMNYIMSSHNSIICHKVKLLY
jgi:hypothetical protein